MNRAFVIDTSDNVATALEKLLPGPVSLLGQAGSRSMTAIASIELGHKIALTTIQPGESVRKYGHVIGVATQAIQPGAWVHLHNMKSRFDERSHTLDTDTGEPTEQGVYV